MFLHRLRLFCCLGFIVLRLCGCNQLSLRLPDRACPPGLGGGGGAASASAQSVQAFQEQARLFERGLLSQLPFELKRPSVW